MEDVLVRILTEAERADRDIERFVDSARQALARLERSGVEVPVETAEAVQRLERIKSQLQAIRELSSKAHTIRVRGDVKDAADEIERLETQISEGLASALRDAEADGDLFAGQLAENMESVQLRVRRLAGELGRARADLREAAQAGNFDPTSESAQRLISRVQRVGREYVDAMEESARQTAQVRRENERVREALGQVSGAAGRVRRDLDRVGQTRREVGALDRSMEALRGKLLAVGAAVVSAFAVDRVQAFLTETVKLRLEINRYERRLKTATGTQEQANKELAFAAKLADDLGLNVLSLQRGYAGLLGATRDQEAAQRGANLTLDQSRDLFEAITVALAANKASQEDSAGVLTAFTQILNKGKLSAEELRQQIGERLPGANALFAKALGVSSQQLDKLLSTGRVAAVDVLPKVAKLLKEEFTPAALAAAREPEAEFNRLNNTLISLRSTFAEGFLQELSENARLGAERLQELQGAAGSAGEAVGAGFALAGGKLADLLRDIELLRDVGAADSLDDLQSSIEDLGDTTEERIKRIADASNRLNQILPGSNLLLATLGRVLRDDSDAAEQAATEVDKLAQAEEEASRARERSLIDLRKRAQAERDLAAEIRGSSEELEDQARTLVGAFRELQAGFEDGVLPEELADEIRDRVEKILESYARYGEAVPPILQAVADEVGALTERQREELDEQQKVLEQIIGNTEDLGERTRAATEAIAGVIEQGIRTAEQGDRIKGVIQDLLDQWADYGEEAPESLKLVADAMGVTTSRIEEEAERQRQALQSVVDEIEELGKRLADATRSRDAGAADELAQVNAEIDELQGRPQLDLADQVRLNNLRDRARELRGELREWAAGNREVAASADEVEDAIRSLLDSAGDDLRQLSDDQRNSLRRSLEALQSLGTTGQASAAAIANELTGVADLFEEAGVDASGLQQTIADLQGDGLDLREAFDRLSGPLGDAAKEAESVGESLEDQQAAVEEIEQRVKRLTEVEEGRLRVLSEQADKIERIRDATSQTAELMPDLVAESERFATNWERACRCLETFAGAL